MVKPLLELVDHWEGSLASGVAEEECTMLRKHEGTGRPLGDRKSIARWEKKLGKGFLPQEGGRPRKK